MRLSKVRLAGFKSFVDPTTLVLPSQLVGIVGPNGCGKSNVIDAVRWVMGESSARHLRGDSMADVIFNGSNARKPVGQASVELVFDNADRALGGPYAEYAEVAVRREVSRDGESHYYLNGVRCRRRDITDLFLGTGLGPRSYAIIEQGTISQFIEARPEDLRLFIEEAAGISRYKERRRETEGRIRQTQENLARLDDVRGELERQLEHLGRQARSAERYRTLKAQERTLRAELLALRWRELHRAEREQAREVMTLETAHAAALARQRELEAVIEGEREAYAAASDGLSEVQGRYYEAAAEVARLDQTIQNARERRAEHAAELARTDTRLAEARAQHATDEDELARLTGQAASATPELGAARSAEEAARAALEAAEAAMQRWQSAWETLNERLLAPARGADVERTRVHHLEQTLLQLAGRRRRLEEERSAVDLEGLAEDLGRADAELGRCEGRLGDLDVALEAGRAELAAGRVRNAELAHALGEARERRQRLSGRLASLEALQEEALGKRQGAVTEWLSQRGLAARPRLVEALDVDEGWERAAETVLGPHLQAVCVEGLDAALESAEELAGGALALFDTDGPAASDPPGCDGLGAHVRAPWSLQTLLAGVQTAGSLGEAGARRPSLAPHESVITPGGVWVGRDWLRVDRTGHAESGVIARERALRAASAEIEQVSATVEALAAEHAASVQALAALEGRLAGLHSDLTLAQRERASAQTRAGERRTRLDQARRRAEALDRELAELEAQRVAGETGLAEARGRLEGALAELAEREAEREALLAEREARRGDLEDARPGWHAARERAQGLAVTLEGVRARLEGLERSVARASARIDELSGRHEALQQAVAEVEGPLAEAVAGREAALARQTEVETELRGARQGVEALDVRLRGLERDRRSAEETAELERSRLEAARLAQQASQVRLQEVQQAVQEQGETLPHVLDSLSEEATEPAWQERLEGVERRVARLGPINLAAIDEHAEVAARKAYLDAQQQDLVEALGTLDNAIRRMDRETRARFRETFDRVNASFQATFPRLLGGGQASLELTGEDLLDTGVIVMARPPGKRNTTIHLLSGGEKALTAVALVFAIFELNPAPFCLLDEVDAPLDDANVGRFCELVRSMAARVQFMLVTHNKTTMELADQLVGVTMHEPGVSRLVHVDVDAALEMAAL
jgi:chromosome segregation protein